MIEYTVGDVLSARAEALVNTVNCVGVMGRGVALQFKKAFPSNFRAYAKACQRREVQPGRMFVFETKRLDHPKFIINFPTKRHWRSKARLADIESGLVALLEEIRDRRIQSVALPPLGSGLGGLHWSEVRLRIEEALNDISTDVRIVVYEPSGPPDAKAIAHLTDAPDMTPGRAALVMLLHRYLGALLDPFVTLLEVHKLMYFLMEAGAPLRLRYTKAQYGPYAENLSHVLHAVEGHLVSGYLDGGDSPNKQLNVVPGAVDAATAYFRDDPITYERMEQVLQLVDGFETPFGLELLSTVHWVIMKDGARNVDEAMRLAYEWNDRKRMFLPEQIELACQVLEHANWLPEDWGTNIGEQLPLA
ncbi:MAG: macro domain-containing protein [Chloroflexi bacterium]|nr:macro domain-containing protein [Chloroflexota bacterium]MYD49044.1 macro domain-containing protein [Chloroflexota bacterium]